MPGICWTATCSWCWSVNSMSVARRRVGPSAGDQRLPHRDGAAPQLSFDRGLVALRADVAIGLEEG